MRIVHAPVFIGSLINDLTICRTCRTLYERKGNGSDCELQSGFIQVRARVCSSFSDASDPCRPSGRQIGARTGVISGDRAVMRETKGVRCFAARSSCARARARRGSGSLNIPLSCPSLSRECATFLFFSLFFRGICQGTPPVRRDLRRGAARPPPATASELQTSFGFSLTVANRTAGIATSRRGDKTVGQMETFRSEMAIAQMIIRTILVTLGRYTCDVN